MKKCFVRWLLLKVGAGVSLLVSVAFPQLTYGALNIPSGLSLQDQHQVVRIVGFGTSTKILSNPFPLGGYPGLSVGVGVEFINATDLAALGSKSAKQEDFSFFSVSIGKGLYNDVDFFIHFLPFSERSGLSRFGGTVRWAFLKMKYLPSHFSLVVHGNSSNINNMVFTQAFGANLLATINVSRLAVFLGVGQARVNGHFSPLVTQNPSSPFSPSHLSETSVQSFYTVGGAVFRFGQFFLALEMDRYTEPVYGLQFGLRM